MIIDFKQPTPNVATHIAVDAETGEDLAGLRYYFADDHLGLLKVHLIDESGRPFMHDPDTGRRLLRTHFVGRDSEGSVMFDYGDGHITRRRPEIATGEIRRPIKIVPRNHP